LRVPIFEYRCRGCGEHFELLVLSSSPAPACPSCRGEDLEKLMSASAVSSAATQKRSLDGAKQRRDKVRFERDWETHKVEHQHHDD
jgi:putative FmdB family regulatory protein